MTNEKVPLYFRYWGKAGKDGDSYHLLPYHCLDVAAAGAVWWEQSSVIRRSFCSHASLSSDDQVRAWLLFFMALHDLCFRGLSKYRILTLCKVLFAAVSALPRPSAAGCCLWQGHEANAHVLETIMNVNDKSEG